MYLIIQNPFPQTHNASVKLYGIPGPDTVYETSGSSLQTASAALSSGRTLSVGTLSILLQGEAPLQTSGGGGYVSVPTHLPNWSWVILAHS